LFSHNNMSQQKNPLSSYSNDRKKVTGLQDELFGLRVWGELGSVDDHGSAHGWDGSSPQGQDALLPEDPEEGVEDVLVVAALVGG